MLRRARFFPLFALVFASACSSAATDPPTTTTPTEEIGSEETAVGDDTGVPTEDSGTEDTAAPPVDGAKPDTKNPVDTAVPPTDTPCTATQWYRDEDGDGFGDSSKTMSACTKPTGHVADKTDCDDKRADVKPGGAEVCDGVDNDCNGTIDGAGCATVAGSYTGTYEIYTAENLGSSVINEMRCTGTSALTIDFKTTPVVKGTVTCKYAGGLTAFGKTQDGTIEATVKPDGTLDGKLTHKFSSSSSGASPWRTADCSLLLSMVWTVKD